MNWLKRHLNWSLVFGWLASYIILVIEAFFVTLFFQPRTPEEAIFILQLIALPTLFIWFILVHIWYLRQKRRSLWNLLWSLVPFGGIIFLRLSNKKKRKEGK